jgi:WD40 repeat protein
MSIPHTFTRSVDLDADNPIKSVRFSPDGSVLGCSSSDSIFRVFSKDLSLPLLSLNTGDEIYDYDFYPGFDQNNGQTRAVLIGSRNRPIRLFNVGSGQSVSSYTAYSFTEEIVHPISIRFSPNCHSIIGGFQSSTARVWDVQTPGRQMRDIVFCSKKSHHGQKGIISSVSFRDEETFFAGSYSSSIYLHDLRDESGSIEFGKNVAFGGVSQLKRLDSFSMVSGHRQDPCMYFWDSRSPHEPVFRMERQVKNFQRFEFDIYRNRYLLSGDQKGDLNIYDIASNGSLVSQASISPVVSVVSVCCFDQKFATGSGVRSFPKVGTVEDSSSDEDMDVDNFSRLAIHSISL